MKRELKEYKIMFGTSRAITCFKTDPDEKGTESGSVAGPFNLVAVVSRLIPMKRELKAQARSAVTYRLPRFKTDPDEKGTESRSGARRSLHRRQFQD